MPHLTPWQWEIAAELAQLVALIVGLVVIAAIVRAGIRGARDDVAQLGRDFHARQDATNERLGDLLRGTPAPAPRPPPLPRTPTPATLDLTRTEQPEKPTLVMPAAVREAAVREATPTPRSRKL